MSNFQRIMIVRTDSIGDVMLTLPMAFYIKQIFPNAEIFFLGKSYTKDIIARCLWVDRFINADDFQTLAEAKEMIAALHLDVVVFALPDKFWMKVSHLASIPMRIATGHRLASWRWATHRPMFGRKNSDLHEAQLNLKLLVPLGFKDTPSIEELGELNLLSFKTTEKRRRLIIHPFSQGSALNWGLNQYDELVGLLKEEDWEMVISGTAKDAQRLSDFNGVHLNSIPSVCGQFDLGAFMDYIADSEMLLACSTGPLHIAAAAGIKSVGLYVDRRPIHPGRWSPIGRQVFIVKEEDQEQTEILTKPSEVATFLKTTMALPTTKQ
jgi:ADP-heptose:LPS heptosyltransferase